MKSRSKRVVFCLPGRSFSNLFLESWTDTLLSCPELGILPIQRFAYCSNVYKVRNGCLQGRKERGVKQKPFQGEIEYDYIMWIDSDQVWTVDQFARLFHHMEEHRDVAAISATCRLHGDSPNYAVTLPGAERLATVEELEGCTDVVEIEGAGLGFCLVREGVFERLDYPWFRPVALKYDDGFIDFTGEDSGFFIRAKMAGCKIVADLGCRVGHEKSTVLR